MIVKEEGSLEMVCPVFRSGCHGAKCMMWRWSTENKTTGGQYSQIYTTTSDTHGYCGLGGLPFEER